MQDTQNMSLKYDSHDFDVVSKNPLFSEAKIYVMYHGNNRNNTHLSKEDVDRAINSIYNIPIVGEFIESEDDDTNFGGHGGQVVIDDNGIKFIHTTRPVGVVPESARVYWEVVKDEKDREREYLVVEGALVWNRYEEEVSTLKSANFGQSMEIEVMDGLFDDDEGIFHIKEFAFSAFCILGIDGRKNGKVEPAFEDSKIITYSQEDMLSELKEMKAELKKYYASYSEQKEDSKVELDKEKNLEEETEKVEDVEDVEDEVVEADKEKEEDKSEDKQESETIQTLEEGKSGQMITDEEEAEKQKGTSGDTGEAGADTLDDPQVIADANTDGDFAEVTELKEELAALKSELEELREFKRNADKESHEKEVIELFNKLGLVEEDVNHLDIYEFSIEELEEKGYAILGKKTAEGKVDFSLEKEDKKSNKVDLSKASKDKRKDKYGGLFAKYSK